MNSTRVFCLGATSGLIPTVAIWLVFVSSVYGQVETQKLLADDGAGGDYFGKSVAVSGDTVLIGAPKVDYVGFDMGAAYVFRRNGADWEQAPRLVAADATLGDHGAAFGYRGVAIDGDTAVIGAPFDYLGPFLEGISIGSAFVFRFNGSEWVQEQKLMPSDGEGGDRFGWGVAVNGNTIAIGSREDDDNGIDAGAVYVYEFDGNTWVERQKLLGSPGDGGVFGNAVSLDGDWMLVGAPFDDATGTNHGAAYAFHRQDGLWTLEQLVVPIPADRQPGSWYGLSVALEGEVMVIGGPSFNNPPSLEGAAFVFRFNGSSWFQEQKLLPPNAVDFGAFGWSVAVSGDTALIGDFVENDSFGAAHVFVFDGASWVATAVLVQSDADDKDPLGAPPYFGQALSLAGSTAAIAAPHRDTVALGGDQGAVYMFDMDDGNARTTTTPDDFNAFRGFFASGSLDDLLESDNSDLCFNPGITLFPGEAPITLDFLGTLPNDSPSSLDVTIESTANTVGLELTFSFWNFSTDSWDVVGVEGQSFNNDVASTFVGSPVDHVQLGTGAVITRYEVRQAGPVFVFPWLDCVDHVFWTTTD